MNVPRLGFFLLSTLILLLIGCPASNSGTENHSTSRAISDRANWSQERGDLERRFEQIIGQRNGFNDALNDGTDAFAVAVEDRVLALADLKERVDQFVNDAGHDPEVTGWAALRIGQSYLNFGCEIGAVPAPEDLTPEQKDYFQDALHELALPLINEAKKLFDQVRSEPGIPWSEEGEFLAQELTNFDEAPLESCRATESYW